jgi:ABC-2 type transport system permease protein
MKPLRKLTWIELKLFAREPFSLIFTLAFPIVLLIVLIGSFKPNDPAFGGQQPSNYYLASYIGVVIGAIGLIALPVHLAAYRERGILRRFQASSIPTWTVIGSHLITGLIMATGGSIVLVLAGTLIYGAALPTAIAPVLGAFLLATVAFQAIGFLLGSVMGSARAAQAVGMLLFFPMWLLSGAAPPPSVMSAAMRQLSDVLPLTYAVRAIQQPWLGSATRPLDLLLLAGLLTAAAGMSAHIARTTWRLS